MDTENALIVASRRDVPTFEFNGSAKEAKQKALEKSALIARVTDGDSKIVAVRAQQELKRVLNAIEKARKDLKEPLLVAGRQLDTLCATESVELEREFGRVANAVKEFDDAERRRVLEEERLQREELERIQREKEAELKRIADEQAAKEREARRIQEEVDRKARELKDAADRLLRDAANKKQREAAQKAQAEAEYQRMQAEAERQRLEADLARQNAEAAAKAQQVQEQAGDAAYVASRPVEITRVAGQVTTVDWEITSINEWTLAKARPDLVSKITFDMRALKAALSRGDKLAGVVAKEVHKAGVKLPPERKAINV